MSGFELVGLIKLQPKWHDIPLVLFSGRQEAAQEAEKMGVDFIAKENMVDLLDWIRKLLAGGETQT